MKAFVFLCLTVLVATLCLSGTAGCIYDWDCSWGCTCNQWWGQCECRTKREIPSKLSQDSGTGLSHTAARDCGIMCALRGCFCMNGVCQCWKKRDVSDQLNEDFVPGANAQMEHPEDQQ